MGRGRWLLVAVVLLCAGSCVWWRCVRDADRGDAAGGVEAAPVASAVAAAEGDRGTRPIVHLVVLNGTDVPELAGRVALLVGRAGCVAERIGNAPHDRFADSLLVNRRLDDSEAALLAARLGAPRLLREWDPRATEDAVLVLGADHDRIESALDGNPHAVP